eukprot:11574296-Alexandrium_andersonii.AAC.1
MSASLVGSEMCIRDRILLAQACASRAPLSEVARAGYLLNQELARSGYFPVSYTHLTLPTICSV